MADSFRRLEKALQAYPLLMNELTTCKYVLEHPECEINPGVSSVSDMPRGSKNNYSTVERHVLRGDKTKLYLEARVQELEQATGLIEFCLHLLERREGDFLATEIIRLVYFKQLDVKTVAQKVGMTPCKVKNRCSKALRSLQVYTRLYDDLDRN